MVSFVDILTHKCQNSSNWKVPLQKSVRSVIHLASFPGSPRTRICICGQSLVSFVCKHDVIEIGLKQKSNILYVVQPTMHSTLGVYDI